MITQQMLQNRDDKVFQNAESKTHYVVAGLYMPSFDCKRADTPETANFVSAVAAAKAICLESPPAQCSSCTPQAGLAQYVVPCNAEEAYLPTQFHKSIVVILQVHKRQRTSCSKLA